MSNSQLIIPIEIQALADRAQVTVDHNNEMKIFNYNEQVHQAKDYSDKGFPVPLTIDTRLPILTKFNRDLYMKLYLQDDADWRAKDGEGKPGESSMANLELAFTQYVYAPLTAPVTTEPIQPKNPLGVLVDDQLGIFTRALGDKLPLGSKFTIMGTNYVLEDFGGQIGGKRLFWVRQG